MRMTGEQVVAAPRAKVWESLNDPTVLARCIPGCQSLDRDGDNRFVAVAEVKIGPIGARFKGNVELSDIDAPNGYTITGSGNGGIAGSAKGGAKVRLSEASGGGTLVSYEVDAEVGGRMAQLGGPIIDATARNLAGKFFATFGEVVSGTSVAAPPAVATTGATASSIAGPALQPMASGSTTIWGWVAAIVAALLSGYAIATIGYGALALVIFVVLLVLTAAAAFEAGRRGGGR